MVLVITQIIRQVLDKKSNDNYFICMTVFISEFSQHDACVHRFLEFEDRERKHGNINKNVTDINKTRI
jgi:hypothetical protein